MDLNNINLDDIKEKISSLDRKTLIKFGIGFGSIILFLIIYLVILKPIVDNNMGSINWINTQNNIPSIKYIDIAQIKEVSKNIQLIKNEKYFIKNLRQIPITPWYIILFLSIILIFSAWYRESR